MRIWRFARTCVCSRRFGRVARCVVFAGLLAGLDQPISDAQQNVALVGSGSSVPAPLYLKWAEAYNKRNPNIQMRYLPLGTSEGIAQISRGSGDFAAGEVPLTAKERSAANLLEFPAVLIGIVPITASPVCRASCTSRVNCWQRFF